MYINHNKSIRRSQKHGSEQRNLHEEGAQSAGSSVPIGWKRDKLYKDTEREFWHEMALQTHHVSAGVDDSATGH